MKIEFNFSLKINGKENLIRNVEFEAEDQHRAESLAVQIIKQLENAKLDAEFNWVYSSLSGGISASRALSTNDGE